MSDTTTNTNSGDTAVLEMDSILTAEETNGFINTLNAIQDDIPFLKNVTEAERRRLPKVGTRTEGFMRNAVAAGLENPGLLPAQKTAEQLRADLATLDHVRTLAASVNALAGKLNDTEMVLEAELYGVARTIYTLLKTPMSVPGMTERRVELGARFARKAKKTADSEAAVAPVKGGVAA